MKYVSGVALIILKHKTSILFIIVDLVPSPSVKNLSFNTIPHCFGSLIISEYRVIETLIVRILKIVHLFHPVLLIIQEGKMSKYFNEM